jgi:hypothetical protein
MRRLAVTVRLCSSATHAICMVSLAGIAEQIFHHSKNGWRCSGKHRLPEYAGRL